MMIANESQHHIGIKQSSKINNELQPVILGVTFTGSSGKDSARILQKVQYTVQQSASPEKPVLYALM